MDSTNSMARSVQNGQDSVKEEERNERRKIMDRKDRIN
jgi:hypothetical protein